MAKHIVQDLESGFEYIFLFTISSLGINSEIVFMSTIVPDKTAGLSTTYQFKSSILITIPVMKYNMLLDGPEDRFEK